MKYLLFSFILLIACNHNKTKNKSLLINDIKKYEQILLNDTSGHLNISAAYEVIKCYSAYANNFPDDSLSPEYLFRQANVFRSINKGKEAINTLKKIENKYPTYPKLDICLFITAEIYENVLFDIENARKYYELFIKKYPNSHLADDAKIILQNLGKTPEELLQNILNNKDTLSL